MSRLVLVTGAAGFIGSNLCDALLDQGYAVRAADNLSAGEMSNLVQAQGRPGFEFHHVDVSDPDVCNRLCEGVSAVLHQAALSSVPASVADPARAHRDTATTTLHLLAACRTRGVSRFLLAASAACYSERAVQPLREDAEIWPLSPYAAAKVASEQYVKAFVGMGVDGACLRYFNVYGPRHSAKSSYANVIPAFTRRILDGGKLSVFGDGSQTRDFVHVRDVVRANLLALHTKTPLGGVSLNIATGRRTALNDLISAIEARCERKAAVDHLPDRPGDFKHSLADVAAARKLLGFEAQVSLEDGIATVVDWMKSSA